jgi:hypothetical protein
MIDSKITLGSTGAASYRQPSEQLSEQLSEQPWEDLESWKKMEREIRQNSPKTPYSKNWKPICKNLALILGHKSFKFYFLKASLVCLTRDTAVIEFENRYKLNYVRDCYMSELRRAIRVVRPRITVIGMKAAPLLPTLRQEGVFYTRKNPFDATSSQNNGDFA